MSHGIQDERNCALNGYFSSRKQRKMTSKQVLATIVIKIGLEHSGTFSIELTTFLSFSFDCLEEKIPNLRFDLSSPLPLGYAKEEQIITTVVMFSRN